jgi:predicted metal-dependent enzyme (double-stranded beta helix superfamily)
MCDTGYSVKRLVEDLRDLKARGEPEPVVLEAARDYVKRLVMMKHNWLRSSMTQAAEMPSEPGVYVLNEEPDHSLFVLVVTWPPGEETRPHDHATWSVIAGLQGYETQHRWKRVGEKLVREGSQRIDSTTIVTLESDAIHSVHNDSGAESVSLHVYGMHPDYTDRHWFEKP